LDNRFDIDFEKLSVADLKVLILLAKTFAQHRNIQSLDLFIEAALRTGNCTVTIDGHTFILRNKESLSNQAIEEILECLSNEDKKQLATVYFREFVVLGLVLDQLS